MPRIALCIEYDGSNYFGWQRQRNHISIQETLEIAISKVANHAVTTACAGRTDAKVHAFSQIIHFDTEVSRPIEAWVKGVNTYLPRDIRVKWSKEVSLDFDARKSALSRGYAYVIHNQAVSPGILHQSITWVYKELDIHKMLEAATHLIGTHDFSAFRGAHCQAKTPIRTVSDVNIQRLNQKIIFEIRANAFLHHMVRNIVGSLLLVGQGRNSTDWIKTLLLGRDRRLAGAMAPAQGLYLTDVSYPDKFCLPKLSHKPWFF